MNLKLNILLSTVAVLSLLTITVFAQSKTPFEGDSVLVPVTIATFSGDMEIEEYVGTIEYISAEAIKATDQTSPLKLLNNLSGVYMHSGALNTNRITIRGIGARTPFSTNKLRAYYGQIPLTDGVGETTIEDIDLTHWGQSTILKGPVSSTYGSGLGGVLLIEPRKIALNSHRVRLSSDVGSFGLRKYGLVGEISRTKASFAFGASNQKSAGYRDNNEFDRYNIYQRGILKFDNTTIEWLGLYVNQFAEIPSSLDEEDYLANPEKAAFTWGATQGFEDYQKYLIGATWSQLINNNFDLKSTIYLNSRSNYEARPFNILTENVFGMGGRSAFFLSSGKSNFQFGTEVFIDNYDWKTIENLYEDSSEQGSLEGDLLSDNNEQRSYVNVFSEYDYSLTTRLKLSLGLSASQTNYKLEKDFPVQENTNYDYSWQLSPKIGAKYELTNRATVFGLISRGFSPPSLEETLTPDGNFNPEIRPEVGWNYEIGSKSSFYKNRVTLEMSIYYMYIKNLLVSRRTGLDQYIGLNAGKTLHTGIEGVINMKLVDQAEWSLNLLSSVSINNFQFVEFVDDENVFDGNQLTGVPEEKIANQLTLYFQNFTLGLNHLYVSEIPITDGNDIFTEAYNLFDFSLSYQRDLRKLNFRVAYRMNNVFDETYASMLAVNAQGFGSNAPRYYYPGLPRHHQISLILDLRWSKDLSND